MSTEETQTTQECLQRKHRLQSSVYRGDRNNRVPPEQSSGTVPPVSPLQKRHKQQRSVYRGDTNNRGDTTNVIQVIPTNVTIP